MKKHIFHTTKKSVKPVTGIMSFLGIKVISTRDTKNFKDYTQKILYEATDAQHSNLMYIVSLGG